VTRVQRRARAAIATVNNLPTLIEHVCTQRGLSNQAAAREIGISHSNLAGFRARSRGVNTTTLLRILEWLAGDDDDPVA
jgi:DNA-binding Xre family transcriptional regulator